jgi:membrane-associated phospholipid phosphatase
MAAYVGFAGAVAASRVHLRAHHPSDVLGGAAIGAALSLLLRPVVNLLAPGSRRRPRRRAARGMGPQGYVLKRL